MKLTEKAIKENVEVVAKIKTSAQQKATSMNALQFKEWLKNV